MSSNYCLSCSKPDASARCSRCKNAFFCDAACQRLAWTLHKKSCSPSPSTPPPPTSSSTSSAFSLSGPTQPPTPPSTLKLLNTPSKGRFAVTPTALAPGFQVLSEKAFVNPVLNSDKSGILCYYCFTALPNTLGLSSSNEVHCSPACRSCDVNFLPEQKGASHIHPHAPTPTILLGCRILRFIANCIHFDDGVATVTAFVGNLPHFSKDEIQTFTSLANMVGQFSIYSASTPAEKTIASKLGNDFLVALLARLSQNGFTISDDECQPLGFGLFSNAAMVNHSCAPNMVASFHLTPHHPPSLRMRTVTAVPAGDELTISYIDVGATTAARQEELAKSYCFTCNCNRCGDFERDIWVQGTMCRAVNCKGVADAQGKCTGCGGAAFHATISPPLVIDTIQEVASSRLVKHFQASYKLSHTRLTAGNELVMRYIDGQDWNRAAVTLKDTLDAAEFCLFPNSPVIAVAFYKLTKLLEYLEIELERAAGLRQRAAQILLVCYGKDNALYKEVSERW